MSKKTRKHKHVAPPPMRLPVRGITVTIPADIAFPGVPAGADVRALADEIIRAGCKRRLHPSKPDAARCGPDDSWLKGVATIATNAWRVRGKMVDPDTGEARDDMKRVYRHVEAIFDALKLMEIDIADPVGRTYDPGMALKVVASEPTPGLSKDTVKETIKPTVVWQGRLLQIGEVIVGTPQTA